MDECKEINGAEVDVDESKFKNKSNDNNEINADLDNQDH